MKQMLLLVFLFSFCISSRAQSVLIKDSVYFSGGTTTEPTLQDIVSYQHDSLCRTTSYQIQLVNPFSGDITNSQQGLYTYYPDGALYQSVLQDWTGDSYQDYARSTTTYTNKGQVSTSLYEVWTDSSFWQPQSFSTTTYDSAGNITDQISQIWNAELNSLVNNTESKFEFNNQHKNTSATTLVWDLDTQTWIPYFRTRSNYDKNNFLVKTTQEYWDQSLAAWQLQTKTEYFNNSQGNVDSSVQTSPQDNKQVNKSYFVYDSVTSLLTQSSTYNYYSGQLFSGSCTLYSHFSESGYQSDTTISQVLILPADTFAVSYQAAFTNYYNGDSSLQREIASFDWDDDNIPFVSDNHYTYAPCQSVLPVSLLHFTGVQKDNNALLQWQATNEVNTSYFMVLRSADGIHFTSIGNISASGNTAGTKNYSYTDFSIAARAVSRLYYRLRITDKDGNVSYSKIVELNIINGKLTVFVSPNPVANVLFVHSTASIVGALVQVMDMRGSILYVTKLNITAGGKLSIDVSGLVKGLYIVTVQTPAEKYNFKVVK